MELKVNCIVLDAVQDDFHPIWEILSVLKTNLKDENDDKVIEILKESLEYLLDSNFVKVYEGTSFQGEERTLLNFKINTDFILTHQNDWKNTDYKGKDFRFSITEHGINFLVTNCKPEYFKNV